MGSTRPESLIGICVLLAAVVLLGCTPRGETATAQGPAVGSAPTAAPAEPAQTEQHDVALKAYINVSSGCQQDTVDQLKRWEQHPRVTLDLVDFGSPEGNKRWRQDGYSCMTILLNGHHKVTIGEQGHRRIIDLTMPPGFNWLPEDLDEAVQQAIDGRIYYGEEPGASQVVRRAPQIAIEAREGQANGREIGQVIIGKTAAITFSTTYQELSPFRRAERAVARLKRALINGLTPAQIRAEKQNNAWTVMAGTEAIAVANAEQADRAGVTAQALAKGWAAKTKQALVAAAGG